MSGSSYYNRWRQDRLRFGRGQVTGNVLVRSRPLTWAQQCDAMRERLNNPLPALPSFRKRFAWKPNPRGSLVQRTLRFGKRSHPVTPRPRFKPNRFTGKVYFPSQSFYDDFRFFNNTKRSRNNYYVNRLVHLAHKARMRPTFSMLNPDDAVVSRVLNHADRFSSLKRPRPDPSDADLLDFTQPLPSSAEVRAGPSSYFSNAVTGLRNQALSSGLGAVIGLGSTIGVHAVGQTLQHFRRRTHGMTPLGQAYIDYRRAQQLGDMV